MRPFRHRQRFSIPDGLAIAVALLIVAVSTMAGETAEATRSLDSSAHAVPAMTAQGDTAAEDSRQRLKLSLSLLRRGG